MYFQLQDGSNNGTEKPFEFTAEHIAELLFSKLNSWMETAISMLPNILLALLVIVVFFSIGSLLQRGTNKAFKKVVDSGPVADLLAVLVKVIVVLIGFVIALDFIHLQKAVFSLLAGAGIIGLAIGFAFQDMAENLLAGIFLSIRKPFLPGHLIQSNGHLGFVQKLNLRNTIIKDFDSQTIYIPNKEVFKNVLENYSQSGLRRIEIPVGVSYGEDLEEVEKTLKQAIETLDFRADETGVEVWALEFGDSSINFSVRYWVPYPEGQIPYFQAISEGVKSIKSHLDDADIQIPFPIRTLDFGIKGGKPLSESLSGFSASSENGESDS